MAPKEIKVIVVIASLCLLAAHFVFLGLVAVAIVMPASAVGVSPMALSGETVFAAVMAVELTLLFVLDKPAPVMLAFSILFVVGQIATSPAVNSEAIRRLIQRLGEVLRTPPFNLRFR
jgi:hypothetical protein